MVEDNPVLVRLWRGDGVESIHRGAWVVTKSDGSVLHSVGDPTQPVYGRSATKSFQALPLIETGAADAFGLSPAAIATALASHSGEPRHIEVVADTLSRIGLGPDDLLCGPQRPFNAGLEAPADRVTNNCSGKHAGFLAVARHLGVNPSSYLDADGQVQQLVAAATAEICSIEGGPAITPASMDGGRDGCSAPTFRLPLQNLATGIARVANPTGLPDQRADACRRMTSAAAAHPDLVAGTHERLCTDLMRVTDGRLFAKIGAEAIYVIGAVDRDLGIAITIDDGAYRGFNELLIEILVRLELLSENERELLDSWGSTVRKNWDGLEIGRVELTTEALAPFD